ncbi:septum site-determining protein MinC [bacterium endosymbiont of Bathymodiolus sp. 5 South]|uniref:septum site-determining protein MinC n=1 Tax=bacterium endosymbiont of Bathymodiolus sp. 5 South TaxID=1181670 RepID=UPI0010BBCC39|nr:septum site-determining protein MinC [bacterium endosymbiont of Bathymodiolus sp. 5 South]SSC07670.1 Septum site-determining protein MinC [bacterium endosymbiont of Bathymodiolus sp. 5 South]VVH63689.1 hypothetical protein BSPWISOX_233 [uncultured Gammaproteobacteria bacterium]
MKDENMNLVEMQRQGEAFYALKVPSKNTEKLFDEITSLLEVDKDKFQYAPVVLEIENKHFQANELAVLIEILTQNNMVTIGIRSTVQELIDFARFSGLVVFDKPAVILAEDKQLKQPNKAEKSKSIPVSKVAKNEKHRLPKIVNNEVSSSEQVFAKDSDLVLLGLVKFDGEAVSHGCVSAYREVCGKVFAGVDGDETATIFIHSFNAQLIAIAGIYKQFEVVPSKLKGHSVMIDLKDGKLRFQIVK